MDLVKIGGFIAQRRKALGLTQKQLAERLGMSDKSVSKWERGICLPDVSLFTELCAILGISINEFFAGESIAEEHLAQQSEENIIAITKDNKGKQKHLRKIIRALLLLLIVCILGVGAWVGYHLFTTVNGDDTAALARQAAHYYDSPSLSVLRTEKRGNFWAAFCKDEKGAKYLCVFDRDPLFPNRWTAAGGSSDLSNGFISSWNSGTPQGDAVLIFCGWDLPGEAQWYQFENNGILYRCPVDADRSVLDIFILPDQYDINGYAILLDGEYKEIETEEHIALLADFEIN